MEVTRGVLGTEGRAKKRTGTSKYDFFKVKVWLGENMDHYYVLSRFLICRMLTVTKIPYIKAVKIALETKKYFVDNNLQDVTQAELENVLFSIIRSKGFDEQYIDCYRMVTQFYQQRQPLCIIVCGAAWTGKSTIAQQLASRINIPNVMQTDVIYELLRAGDDSPLNPTPLWCRPGLSDSAVVAEFRREACIVRKGMDGDLIKTLSDGKPIIIEGMHLDPGQYIHDFGRRGIIMLPAKPAAGLSPVRRAAHSPVRGVAAAAAQQPAGLMAKAGYRRSLTVPALARREASPTAETAHGAAGGAYLGQDSTQQQQQGVSCSRSMSAGVELSSAGPAVAAAVGVCRLPPTPEVLDAQAADSVDAAAVDPRQLRQPIGDPWWQQRDVQQHQQQQQQSFTQHLQQLIQQPSEDSSTDTNRVSASHTSALEQPHVLALASSGQENDSSRTQHQLGSKGGIDSRRNNSTASFNPGIQGTETPNSTRNDRNGQDMGLRAADLAANVEGRSQDDTSAVAATAVAAVAVHNALVSAVPGSAISSLADGQQTAVAAAAFVQTSEAAASPAAAAAADLSGTWVCSGPSLEPPAVIMLGELQVCAATAEAFALQQHWQQYQQQQPHSCSQQQQQLRLAPPDSPYSSADSQGGRGMSPSLSLEHSTTEVVSRQQSCCSPLLSQELSASELGPGVVPSVLSTSHSTGLAVLDVGASQQELQQQDAQQDLDVHLEEQQQQQQGKVVAEAAQQGKLRNKTAERWHHQQHQHEQHCSAELSQPSCSMASNHVGCGGLANGFATTAATTPTATFTSLHNNGAAARADIGAGLQQLRQLQQSGAAKGADELSAAMQDVAAAEDKQTAERQQQQQLLAQQEQQQSGYNGCSSGVMPAAAPTAATAAAADFLSDDALGPGAADAAATLSSSDHETCLQADKVVSSKAAQQQGGRVDSQQDSRVGAQQDKREPVQRPLFVPILVYMDEADHALMQEEALSHVGLTENQPSSEAAAAAAAAADGPSTGSSVAAASGAGGTEASTNGVQISAPEALRRMQLLQEYLCAYEAQGLPVVKVSYGNFGEALDKLHEYILQCIKCAQSTML